MQGNTLSDSKETDADCYASDPDLLFQADLESVYRALKCHYAGVGHGMEALSKAADLLCRGGDRTSATTKKALTSRLLVRALFVAVSTSALGGTRTPNLLIRSQVLYPLSYERSRTSIPCPQPW